MGHMSIQYDSVLLADDYPALFGVAAPATPLGRAVWPRQQGAFVRRVQPPAPPPAASETGITEGQWLAGAVVGRLAELVGAAALREGVAAPFGEVRVSAGRGPDSYGVEVNRAGGGQSLKFGLDLAECVWSAKEYVAISRALQKEAGVERDQPEIKIPANPIVVLSEFSVEAIESENQRISKWLSEHPRDAEGHEQAAMLLGTLGMRENSGRFWDARGFCNRATAHLAFAQALRNGGRFRIRAGLRSS
jgi:hypothetical protein